MAVSPFNFSVSESVQGVSCHLNWIQDFLPHLERTALDKAKSLSKYLTLLLEEEFQTFGGRIGFGEEDEKIRYDTLVGTGFQTSLGSIGQQLNITSFYCYLGDFDSARKHLECAKQIVVELENENLELENDLLSAVKYCLDAAEWTVKVLMMEDGKIVAESKTLTRNCNTIQSNHRSRATITFFKAILGDGVRAKEDIVRNLFEEVASLDQDYFLWQHYAYKNVRKTRSCYKIGELGAPGEVEISYCEKAFQLRPDYLPIIVDYAQLLKEALWTKPAAIWEENAPDVETCINVFKNALQIAEKNETKTRDGKFWLGKLKVHFGEYLLFGKSKMLDQKLGKQLFDECLETYPKCNWVLHKMAKLHHWGAFGTDLHKDAKNAEVYYLLSLNQKSTFPCLKDYGKLLMTAGRLEEFIQVTKKFLYCCRRDDYIVWLRMDLGCVQFLYSQSPNIKEKVCRSWIRVLMKYPDHREVVCVAFKRRFWMDGKYSYIPRRLVIETMEENKIKAKKEEEIETISFLIDELKKQEEELKLKRRYPENELVRGMDNKLRTHSSPVGMNTGDWRHNTTRSYQPRIPSEADLDNNWRSGKL